jgi:DNA repair protein RecN (Recombination protein N)
VLIRLHIRNLAVIDEVELDLEPGFGALTGETGAGKSMLVDALLLTLGARADSGAVRSGAERTEVTAVFRVDEPIRAWLAGRDLDTAGDCQLRRVVTAEGRSRGYINGQPVPLESLRELGEQLVEICGQHAHQTLLQPAAQRDLLDAHGRHEPLLDAVASAHAAWSRCEGELAALRAASGTRDARRELLGYQVGELGALNLQVGEYPTLDQERQLLANAGRIGETAGRVLESIYDAEDGAAHDMLGAARRQIEALADLDPLLAPVVEALDLAAINVGEAAERLRQRIGVLDHDPARLEAIETRLAAIHELARKHRCEPAQLPGLLAALQAEFEALSGDTGRLGQLETESARARARLNAAADALGKARRTAAGTLATQVSANLRDLGMPEAIFSVQITPLPEARIGPAGADHIDFLVSTNPGQEAGPIARVASGGELSRLSLALAVVVMTGSSVRTLVFDEVDAGIGGGVAEMVGRSLRRLSRTRQVLCVTHLPQVASQAHHHYAVSKQTTDGMTRAGVHPLTPDERVEEIARMLGGVRITDRTRAHAREMLAANRPRRAG